MANAIRRGKWQIAVLAIGTCAALTASAYTDGEVIAYFPFDTDYASIVNTGKNPATFPTFGTVAITTGGRLALDLTAFGIDESINKMTFEFF